MRNIVFLLLLLALTAFGADFERSNWHTQLYLQVEPYTPIKFDGKGQYLNDPVKETVNTVPLSLGYIFNPLFTPLFKADIPITFWLGGEIGEFQFGDISSNDNYHYDDGSATTQMSGEGSTLSFISLNPAGLAGFTFNIAGNLDLRVLGGFGIQYYRFSNEVNGSSSTYTTTAQTMFVSGALEYKLVEVFQDVDLKVGVNVRKEFKKLEDFRATKDFDGDKAMSAPSAYSGVMFDKIETKLPVRIALEFSLDFGRESRRDRKMRFALRDRDSQLRQHSEVKDTLSDWDCMAIERDYHFFLDGDSLPDMSEKFTKAQFADVLESYLAFCHPEDLNTKEKLYSTLDSNKISVHEYQTYQEGSRYKQVMASNDVEMLQMYLEYYPNSPHKAEIEAKLNVLGDYQNFKDAQAANTFKAYLKYLNDFPNGSFRDEAEQAIFTLVQEGNRVKDYEIYLKRFPDGKFVSEAKHALHELQRTTGASFDISDDNAQQEQQAPAPVKKKSKKGRK